MEKLIMFSLRSIERYKNICFNLCVPSALAYYYASHNERTLTRRSLRISRGDTQPGGVRVVNDGEVQRTDNAAIGDGDWQREKATRADGVVRRGVMVARAMATAKRGRKRRGPKAGEFREG